MKGNLLAAVLFGMIAALSASAADEQWELYFRNSQGDEFYYDVQSIRKEENKFRPVMLVDIKRLSARTDVPVKAIRERMQVDCSKMVYRRTESEVTRRDDSVYTSRQATDWDPVLEDSSFRAVVDAVCSKTGSSRRR